AYEEIWGRSCESLLAAPQSWMKAVHEDDQDGVTEAIAGATGRDWSEVIFPEYRIVRPNGDIRWIQARAFPARDGTGEIARVVGIAEDITDHKNMERQLLHAQKMEAVGQLTGGIAHDFNNLLQVIESNLDVLAKHPGLDKDSSILVSRALDAGRRGANLTRHLLAFSRRQLLHPAVVEPNELIGGWVRILTRTLGEDVAIETRLADSLPPILVDPGGLESALLNLALNARAAMANGGTLTISTAEIERGKTIHADGRSLPAGKYVEIAIADTGCGIPDEILERVFEPFFTTKEVGEGSGLGLSMVYGFVRQSRGDVGMTSKPGSGTTVRMVFPAAEPGSAKTAEEAGSRDLDIEHDTLPTVLVVEDEPSVRDSTVTILESLGLRVVAVGDGHEALEALSVNASIGLMITDMVMPKGLDGLQLARKATRHTPDLRVIIATGYPEPHRKTEGMAESGFVLLNKPYKVNDLIAALDRVWTGAPDP
ncbi:MAG: response regulator, partial [Rhodospirillales bacterium]|nr:response regulator [Rhodospirillales bacterium]